MIYELWDVESGNRIERFASEIEALSAVRELLALNGADYLHALALGAAHAKGGAGTAALTPVLDGEALLTRDNAAVPANAAS